MFDLATAKIRLGLTTTAQDALVTLTLSTAIAVAERYCDRKFMYAAETVKFYDFHGHMMFLPRYPIVAVLPSSTGIPSTYHVHNRLGAIELHGATYIETASIDYAGGYQVLPADLELALWGVFDTLWPTLSGGGTTVAAGTIESITVSDVGTVRFAANSGNANASGGSGDAAIYGPYFSILQTYRRETC
jgi:hypothetical protein